jgi:hypothetical protein
LISASNDRTLKVWDIKSGQVLATLDQPEGAVTACAVTPDGRRVVSASNDKTLKIWDLETERVLVTLTGHRKHVTACTVTPDGQRVISASNDRTLKVWDLESGRLLATLKGHGGPVMACAVTPDGRHVVSASWDCTLKIWDLETYACTLTHHGYASHMAVTVSERAIIAGDAAGGLCVLDWPSAVRGRTTRSPGSAMTKHTILFLAANPLDTDRLALDCEARAIQDELDRSGDRDKFELVTRWAAEPLDLLRELRKLRPSVVHFSGHGSIEKTAPGLCFQGPGGHAQMVSAAALRDTFAAAGGSVKVVVLNACYSDPQAEALAEHVDCIVGMHGPITDAAARSFAIGFYGGLGERESVAAAYGQGCAAIRLGGQAETDRPRLTVRAGVDAHRLVLTDTSRAMILDV